MQQKLINNVISIKQDNAKYDKEFKVKLSDEELKEIPSIFYDLTKDQLFELFMADKITKNQYVHIENIINLKTIENSQEIKNNNDEFRYPHLNENNKPIKCHENLDYLMQQKKISARYNNVSRNVEILGTDHDNINLAITHVYSLARKNGLNLSKSDAVDFIDLISSENAYNPVIEYLENAMLKWDGVSRIQELVDTLITDDKKINPVLKYELVRAWLVSTVRITKNTLYNPINAEGLLVLQGQQGIGKTEWIKSLIPDELRLYFKEGVQLNVDNKDSIYQAICNWICELGELDGTLKSEQASLKAFFTNSIDVQRRPYAVKEEHFPRTTSFFGTVNDEEFLKDGTGDRRYWVIPINGIKFNELKQFDLLQLWGEAMNILMIEQNAHKLNDDVKAMLNESNANYRVLSQMDIKVQSHFDWDVPRDQWKFIKTSEIADKLALRSSSGLKTAIQKMGGEFDRDSKVRGYVVPPFKSVYNI